MAVNEITPKDILIFRLKEGKVAVLLGILLGVFSFARVVLFAGNAQMSKDHSLIVIGSAISAAMAFQVLTATLIGALLPLAAARLNLDPALVANASLTRIVDISGLLFFLSPSGFS